MSLSQREIEEIIKAQEETGYEPETLFPILAYFAMTFISVIYFLAGHWGQLDLWNGIAIALITLCVPVLQLLIRKYFQYRKLMDLVVNKINSDYDALNEFFRQKEAV